MAGAEVALGGDLLRLLLAGGVGGAGVAAVGHGDVVVGATARAVGAADAEVVDVDLAVLLAMDGAGGATDHALGVGAVVAARRHQHVLVLALLKAADAAADLLAAPGQARGAMPRVAA